jgi:hypothetical protein
MTIYTMPEASAVTRVCMRALGERAANDFLADMDVYPNPDAASVDWRTDCKADIVKEYAGHADLAGLVASWDLGFDSVQPTGLTASEMGMLKAYRLSDDRGRESIYSYARSMAEDWPRCAVDEDDAPDAELLNSAIVAVAEESTGAA